MKIFKTLQNGDVITNQISDHQPVIHDNVLFWNIMMQGKRRGLGFNNGFGIVETDDAYAVRLGKIAEVIAEIISQHPAIIAISLCEGPISTVQGPLKSFAVTHFIKSLNGHAAMQRFSKMPHSPCSVHAQDWGLMLFTDNRYVVNPIASHFVPGSIMHRNLGNRFQIWQLKHLDEIKHIALAHFPFAGNEEVSESLNLSARGKMYVDYLCFLLGEYENQSLIFCADFNLNPYLISQWQDRWLDKIPTNNSILLSREESKVKAVTVDGILLSIKEKQQFYNKKFHAGLFSRLRKEQDLLLNVIQKNAM